MGTLLWSNGNCLLDEPIKYVDTQQPWVILWWVIWSTAAHRTGHGLHLTCTRLRWLHPNTKEAIEVSIAPAKKMIRAVPGQFEPVANARSEWLPLFAPASRS